ncbi:MAG: class I SAM-dependent methyltransferase [Anaerolineaceae bacterium]|nr:class I SAM-dependent methyltransferase [Anaerolineaceae bacterium]
MCAEQPDHENRHLCPWWLAYAFDNPLRKLLHKPEDLFQNLVHPGDMAADIGCGFGYFSISLAKLVGEDGIVFAVDIQPEMLEKTLNRAASRGVDDRIQTILSTPARLGLDCPVDFVLLSWMLHEVTDPQRFLPQVIDQLKPGGHLLLIEPILHVSQKEFASEVALAVACGLEELMETSVSISHATLFQKP